MEIKRKTTGEFDAAVAARADRWVPASGGTETPLAIKGFRLLYVFNPFLRKHAYLDCDRDIVLSESEVDDIMRGNS